MTTPMTRLLALSGEALPDDSLVLADGTLWSHAATLGTYSYGGERVTLDQPTIESFVTNFRSGYPKKVPVDYEHASTDDDPEIRKLRAQGKIPMAGQAIEFRGVFAPADFASVGSLQSSAEKLAAKEGRPLADPRNFGLWMRWQPTEDALKAVKARHVSQLSIAFTSDTIDNTTGKSLGPGLLAVGLVARPFLDEMISVAASQRGASGSAAAPPNARSGEHMSKITLTAAVAALVAKQIATEDEAVTELGALQPELVRLRAFEKELSVELGEVEPTKAVARLKALKTENAEFSAEAKRQKTERIDSQIKSVLKDHETLILPAQYPFWTKQLRAELEADVALDKTETLAAIKALSAHGITKQSSGGDQSANVTEELAFKAKRDEILEKDAEVKALSASNPNAAMLLAAKKATEQLTKK